MSILKEEHWPTAVKTINRLSKAIMDPENNSKRYIMMSMFTKYEISKCSVSDFKSETIFDREIIICGLADYSYYLADVYEKEAILEKLKENK